MANALGTMLAINPIRVLSILKTNNNLVAKIRCAIIHEEKLFFEANKKYLLGDEECNTEIIFNEDLIPSGNKKSMKRISRSIADAYLACGDMMAYPDRGVGQSGYIDTEGTSQLASPQIDSFKNIIPDNLFKELYESFTPQQMSIFKKCIDTKCDNNMHLLQGVAGGGKSVVAAAVFCWYINYMYQEGMKNGIYDFVVYIFGRSLANIHNTTLQTLARWFHVKIPHRQASCLKIGNITISLVSLDNNMSIEVIRGSNMAIGFIDECTNLRKSDFLQIVNRMRCSFGNFQSRLILASNYGLRTCTPAFIEDHKDELKCGVHVLRPSDNPYLPEGYMDRIKATIDNPNSIAYKLHVLGQHVDVSDGFLNVYQLRSHHIIEQKNASILVSKTYSCEVWIGADYGNSNPRVYTACAVFKNYSSLEAKKYWVEVIDTLYYPQYHAMHNTRDMYDMHLDIFLKKFVSLGVKVHLVFPHDCVELYYHYNRLYSKEEDISVEKTKVRPVEDGIARIRYLLMNDLIHITDNCTELIDEFHKYSYLPSQDSSEFSMTAKNELKPKKSDDHCLDSLRYAIDQSGVVSHMATSDINTYNTEEKLLDMMRFDGVAYE
ncbi:MAG: terminase large subunit domain-containing protein [Paraclostridium sp.]